MNKFSVNRQSVKFCPCGRDNRDGKFAPFLNQTEYGYCHSCCKTFLQQASFYEDKFRPCTGRFRPLEIPKRQSASLVPKSLFIKSLNGYSSNNLVKFLVETFGKEVAMGLVKEYWIGTAKYWPGSTIYWQVDEEMRIRTGKVMLYEPITGKRVKNPFDHITWAHKVLKLPSYTLKQCLFGQHLLKKFPHKTVGLVESEKTALIATQFYPGLLWLATGSMGNFNERMVQPLKGRQLLIYPDGNSFEVWKLKAKKCFNPGSYLVSEVLERNLNAKQKSNGDDLADFLLSKR